MLQVSDILKTNQLLRCMCTHSKEPQQMLDESHILEALLSMYQILVILNMLYYILCGANDNYQNFTICMDY